MYDFDRNGTMSFEGEDDLLLIVSLLSLIEFHEFYAFCLFIEILSIRVM